MCTCTSLHSKFTSDVAVSDKFFVLKYLRVCFMLKHAVTKSNTKCLKSSSTPARGPDPRQDTSTVVVTSPGPRPVASPASSSSCPFRCLYQSKWSPIAPDLGAKALDAVLDIFLCAKRNAQKNIAINSLLRYAFLLCLGAPTSLRGPTKTFDLQGSDNVSALNCAR